MKKLFTILALLLLFINTSLASEYKIAEKEYKVLSDDSFSLSAVLKYPQIKNKQEYGTVVLLHSLGYNSEWWENLPQQLLDSGYAVLLIDFRGHGKSIYNSKLTRVSWTGLKNPAFAKYPSDVIKIINYVKNENKRVFFNNWAIVGSDIGASTAIYVANNIEYKPKTIVIISPVVKAKSLYIPVELAELENIDVLSISGNNDTVGMNAENYLKKFAQSTFATYKSQSKSTGMLLLKNDPTLSAVITSWIKQYLQ